MHVCVCLHLVAVRPFAAFAVLGGLMSFRFQKLVLVLTTFGNSLPFFLPLPTLANKGARGDQGQSGIRRDAPPARAPLSAWRAALFSGLRPSQGP